MRPNLNAIQAWVCERPERSATIEIHGGRHTSNGKPSTKVWVYDYNLGVGQHVQAVSEIDLEGVKEQQERAEYERLRAKYEEAPAAVTAEAR